MSKPCISPETNMIIGNITIAPIPKKIPKPVSGGPVYPGIELANENIEVHSNAMITPTTRPMTALIAPDINARGIAGILITVFPSIIMHLRIQALVKNQSEYKDLGFHGKKSKKTFSPPDSPSLAKYEECATQSKST